MDLVERSFGLFCIRKQVNQRSLAQRKALILSYSVGVGALDDPHLKPSNKKARPLGELSSACETERA